ncbi:hypothetical protein [Candidatus Nitrospira bockiana]
MRSALFPVQRRVKVWQNVSILVCDATTRRLVLRRRAKNRVPTGGLNHLCDLLKGDTTAKLTDFAVGIGTNAVQPTDTGLQSEVFRAAITKMTRAGGTLTITYFLPSTAANSQTLSEAGVFAAAGSGALFSRVTFAGIAKTSSLTITFVWTVHFSSPQLLTAGLNHLCDLLKGDSTARLSHVAVGTGTLAVQASQTALHAEVARVAIVTMTRVGGVLTLTAYLPSVTANGSTLTEAGAMTAAGGGVLFSRVVHSAKAKANTNTITYVETVSFTAS